MNIVKEKIIIFITFFILSFILGYDSLYRYDHEKLLSKNGNLSDVNTYQSVIIKGFEGFYEEKRLAPRIITPLVAHYVYKLFNGKTGSWNPVFFSILLINSFFVSITCVLMLNYLKFLKYTKNYLPQFFFITSFGVSSMFLIGLIDAALCFFIFFYIYAFLNKKYSLVILSSILMCLSKETSFIYIFFFNFSYFVHQIFFEKKIIKADFFIGLVSLTLNIIIINYYVLHFLQLNIFDYIFHHLETGGAKNYVQSPIDIVKYFYYFIPIALFIYPGLKIVERKFVTIIMIMFLCHFLFLEFYLHLDGNAIGRYMFNFFGPILCIFAGIGFNEFVKKSKV